MSREELDMLERAARLVAAAQAVETLRSHCPTHGKTYRQ